LDSVRDISKQTTETLSKAPINS